jgi:hypothetical protein
MIYGISIEKKLNQLQENVKFKFNNEELRCLSVAVFYLH